jgi:hypothetical protein
MTASIRPDGRRAVAFEHPERTGRVLTGPGTRKARDLAAGPDAVAADVHGSGGVGGSSGGGGGLGILHCLVDLSR